jgi:hypothetical protein
VAVAGQRQRAHERGPRDHVLARHFVEHSERQREAEDLTAKACSDAAWPASATIWVWIGESIPNYHTPTVLLIRSRL